MIQYKKIKQISPELTLSYYNQIPVLELNHPHLGEAKIALQGAQLLSWKPKGEQQDILWLSPIEPFLLGQAIRGGIPICYPWFGATKKPIHGTARLALWKLSHFDIDIEHARIELVLLDQQHIVEAKVVMLFSEKCELIFTHYGKQAVQAAFHTYFNVGNIEQVEITHLPTVCFNALTQQQEKVSSSRRITQHTDCIYTLETATNYILDHQFNRQIEVTHQNATETVLWNPWDTVMSAMQERDYQNMLCLETARIYQLLHFGESIRVTLARKKSN
ncbi:D-hexose-6-phosphate mutarotase [Pasteurella multocida]|uniref:D-hexose-6-phosphate mutarotase n=1 Tax=Pasteurella multocida TaxID=747 RepID=UPI001F531FCC|nr:D-hexose-6-phosphate mutarotase [Pasteurella multocida]